MSCTYCGSNRVVVIKNKTRCLDCHKTANRGSPKKQMCVDNVNSALSLIKKVSSELYLSRDMLGDAEEYKVKKGG